MQNPGFYEQLFQNIFGKFGAVMMEEIIDSGHLNLYSAKGGYSLTNDNGEIIHFDDKYQITKLCLFRVKIIPSNFLNECICQHISQVDLLNATEIGDGFLRNAPNLLQVNIPKVGKTGANCFSNVPKLSQFQGPSLKISGGGLLRSAPGLKRLDLPVLQKIQFTQGHMTQGSFCDVSNLQYLNVPKFEASCDNVFVDNHYITHVELNNMTSLPGGSFVNWTKLETISLDKATYVGDYSFENCNNLSEIFASDLDEAGIKCHPLVYGLISKNKGKNK